MNVPLILRVSVLLLLGGVCGVHAQKAEERKEVRVQSSSSISSSVSNEKGTVKYNNREVWKGKVRKGLNTIAKSVDGEDLAAAWDGKRLVWENVKGAGQKLEPELRELLKKQKDLQR